jgi:hypothetical protein
VVEDKKNKRIICTAFANGKWHNFRLCKESQVRVKPETEIDTDTGYQGLTRLHADSVLLKKKTKQNPLIKGDKAFNHAVSSRRLVNKHIIGCVKRFRIVSDTYRNRRKRFGLCFNLIAAIYNLNLIS